MGCRCHHTKQSAHSPVKRGGAIIIRYASVNSPLAPPLPGGGRHSGGVGGGWLVSGQPGPVAACGALVRTNVACWVPGYERLRRCDKDVLVVVGEIADHGLGMAGKRWWIPAPDAAHVDNLVELGRRLNAVARQAHNGSEDVETAELAGLLDLIGEKARLCAESFPAPARKYRRLCVGPLTAKLNVHAPPEVMDAYKDAARVNGMRFSTWIRDGVAAHLGETSPRVPAESTKQAIAALWRIGGLLTQIGYLINDMETHLGRVEAALGDLDARLIMCGAGR